MFSEGTPASPTRYDRCASYICGAAAVIVLLCGCNRKAQNPTAPPPVAVTVAPPVEEEVINYAEFTGNTEAVQSVDIRARVTGYLNKIGFNEGAIVKTGEVLFVIDPRPYQAAYDQAKANVEQAQAQLELAKSNFQRAEDLRRKGVISPQDYDTQAATQHQAAASLLANQAAVETAKLNLDFTEVRSPIDGRTSTYGYTIGNLIVGGDTSSSGVLTSVVSTDPIYVYFSVEERGMLAYEEMIRTGKVPYAPGGKTPVEMQLANETEYPHQGFVDFVDNRVDPSTGTIKVRAAFENKDGLLRPGLFARVRIPASPKFKANLISDLAVGYDQGQPIVYVVGADNVVTAKPVKIGALWQGLRVAEEGINPNDRIVVNGVIHLRPGVKVTPQDGKMKDFAQDLRQQISVGPTRGEPKPNSQKSPAPEASHQPEPPSGK
jgi:RND family efflux transporter MFP subunit